jgi:hypothetical protein
MNQACREGKNGSQSSLLEKSLKRIVYNPGNGMTRKNSRYIKQLSKALKFLPLGSRA